MDEESIARSMARERALKKAKAEAAIRTHKPKTLRPPPPTTPPSKAIANSKITKEADQDISIEEFLNPSPPSKLASQGRSSNVLKYETQDEVDENDDESYEKIKDILKHASVLEGYNELEKVENLYQKALLLGPTDIKVLDSFAVFLHRKRGDISRAESLFRRAIQVHVPQLMKDLKVGVSKGARPPLESPNHSPSSYSASPPARSPLDSLQDDGRRTSV